MRARHVFSSGAAALSVAAAGASALGVGPVWRGAEGAIEAREAGVVMDRRAVAERLRQAVGDGRRVVVTLSGPADGTMRAALAEAGIVLVSPVGGGSYVARIDAARMARDVDRGAGMVGSVESITPAMRMHPMLSAGEVPAHAVVAEDAVLGRTVALAVQFHADATDAEIDGVIAASGAIERSRAGVVRVVTLEVQEVAIGVVGSADAVSWIEPVTPGLTECNAGCRALAQVDVLFAPPYGLTGAGVGVLVYDAGRVASGHVDFQGRVSVHDASPVSDHGTHVAGTIAGAGVANAVHRGVAPGVVVRSFGFEASASGTFLATNPGDIEADWAQAFGPLGVAVGNASLGTNVEVNGFPCALQGDYTTTDALLDALVHGNAGMRAVWAAGNERQGSRCDVEGFGDYYSVAPPAGSKNAIIVGSVGSNNDQVSGFSSWGPTDDGRLKPDIVATGCQFLGDGGVTSTSSAGNTSYSVKCGTSMATPVVTGIIALLLEDFADQFPGEPLPSNAWCKAVLIQSAADIGPVGPDYTSGYGSVRALDAVELVRAGQWAEGSVGAGEERVFLVDVPAGAGPARFTIAWDDAPGSPAVLGALVNDLDLVVRDPNGTRRYPWTVNPAAPSAAAVRTQEDHRNNVEQVVVDAPVAGVWEVVVRGSSVPQGPQRFAMAASHELFERSVEVSWIDAPPAMVQPGEPFVVRVMASGVGQDVASVVVRERAPAGTGEWIERAMTHEGSGVYAAAMVGASCEEGAMEMEVVALGAEAGSATLPESAPAVVGAGVVEVVMATTSEADDGWIVNAQGTDTAHAGVWDRMAPEATAAQPGADAPDAGDLCWVTDGRAGASVGSYDVDSGVTTVTTPTVDLTGAQSARLTFWGWFSNTQGADPGTDAMVVRASSDGGATWTVVEMIGPKGEDADGGWFTRDIELAGVIVLSDAVRVRFEASDAGLGSVVEAAVDDVRITAWWCEDGPLEPAPECAGDVNGDGVVNAADFTALAASFGMTTGATRAMGDVTGDGAVNAADFAVVAGSFGRVCE
jgi:subtilisin family serine protease